MKGAKARAINSESVNRFGKKVSKVEDSRFLDPVKARAAAPAMLASAVEMRTLLDGVTVPLNTAITIGSSVYYESEKMFPGVGQVPFEVISQSYNFKEKTMTLGLRSHAEVDGATQPPRKAPGAEPSAGRGAPRGRKGDQA
jgi:hypothetical protein